MIDKQKYKKIFSSELEEIRDLLIWRSENDVYHLFNIYQIRKCKFEYQIYKHDTLVYTLNKMMSAVSWCIADKFDRHDVSTQIVYLDEQLDLINNDIFVRQSIYNKHNDHDFKALVEVKLDSKHYQKRQVERQLKQNYRLTKHWQTRGFNNELIRT